MVGRRRAGVGLGGGVGVDRRGVLGGLGGDRASEGCARAHVPGRRGSGRSS